MSSWRFESTVNIDKLLELSRRVNSIPDMLEETAAEVAKVVRENIKQENIIDTGALLASIKSEMESQDTAIVKDGVTYGVYNEFGTYKMAARPFFIPAVEKFGTIIERKFIELMR